MSNQQVQDDEIDLRQLFGILLGGKWTIAGCVFVAAVIAFIYLMMAKPVFVANALIQVEEKQSGLAGFGDLESLLEGESSGSTEIEVIKSRFVLGDVVQQELLQVDVVPKYFPFVGEFIARRFAPEPGELNKPLLGMTSFSAGGEIVEFDQFYIEDDIAPLVLTLIATAEDRFQLFDEYGEKLLEGAEGQLVTAFEGSLVFNLSNLEANQGAEFDVFIRRNVDAANSLRESLGVSEKGRDTGIISLKLEGTKKYEIRDTLNSVVNTYQKQNVKRLSEEAERSIQFLNIQIPSVRGELEGAEQALNNYRAQNSSLDIELETKAALDQLITIESQLNELELKESDISSRYKKDHPLYSALLEQRGSLVRERDRINNAVESLPATQQELLRLMRNVEVTNQIYLQLLGKQEELKVIRAGTVGNVRILDEAEVQTLPIAPKKPITMILAVFVGGFIGLVIVFGRHILNAGIKSPTEVQEKLDLPNYGVVPKSDTQSELLKKNNGEGVSVLAVTDKKDLALEAIRSIRTSLHFAMMEASDNVVMLTGPSPGIGKSFISTNLAALVAETGQKVLLIDADMRRGHINKTMGVKREQGLSELLSQSLSIQQVTHVEVIPNVDFIATGGIPPNPSELLMSGRFSEFLATVRSLYDLVLIDTPPTLAVTDAMIVGKQVGTTMAVVKHNSNTLREVEQMKDQADKLGVTIKGYIYNFMEYNTSGYGYYGNRYYNYGYYGMNEDELGGKNA